MPDDISFFAIPANLRDPGVYLEIDASRAVGNLPARPRRVLLIGQRLTGGTLAAGVLQRMQGPNDGKTCFGRGSMLAAMVEAAVRASPSVEVHAVALDDASGGTAPIWHVSITGPATSSGTIPFYIGGPSLNRLTGCGVVYVAVTAGMTAAQIATALAAAISAANADLPVTGAVDGTTTTQVNITGRHKGEALNDLDFRTRWNRGDTMPAGVTLAVTLATPGAGNPALTPAIAAIGGKAFTDFVLPYRDTTSTTTMSTEMARRYGPTVQQDGMVWHFSPQSLGTLETLGSSLNDKLMCIAGMQKVPTPSWMCAAIIGQVAAYYLQIDPAAALDDSITLPGIAHPASADEFGHDEREALLHDGIATLIVNDNGDVCFSRMITTCQTDGQGIPTDAYLDVETLQTLAYLRFWTRVRIKTKWPRFKLADDPASGQPLPTADGVTCPKLIGEDLIAGSNDLYEKGLIDNVDDFAANLKMARNPGNDDEVDALLPWSTIKRFRVFAGQIQFR